MQQAVKELLIVYCQLLINCCRGDRIRTCDPLVPNQMRYRAAPLPDSFAQIAKLVLTIPERTAYRVKRNSVEEAGFEPAVPLRVRQFSKLLVSATHPSLRLPFWVANIAGCKSEKQMF